MNANRFLSRSERETIEQAIADVEKRTSAEVVCAVATESGRYDRSESIWGLAGSLLGLGVVRFLASGPLSGLPGRWVEDPVVSIGWEALAVVVGFMIGSVLASYVHPLRKLFVSEAELQNEVLRAADHVFMARRLSSTKERGGLLIYVSLFERQVVVLTDQGIMTLVGQSFLDELRDGATLRLQQGRRLEAFIGTLRLIADKLSVVAPPLKDDVDELPNRLCVIHPRP